jgi:hypothetical protein
MHHCQHYACPRSRSTTTTMILPIPGDRARPCSCSTASPATAASGTTGYLSWEQSSASCARICGAWASRGCLRRPMSQGWQRLLTTDAAAAYGFTNSHLPPGGLSQGRPWHQHPAPTVVCTADTGVLGATGQGLILAPRDKGFTIITILLG